LDAGEELDPLIAAALHSAHVVSYSRPFKDSISKSGERFRYPVSRISDAEGFDRELHDHLLTLRDGMVAHSDPGLADRMVNHGVAQLTVGEEQRHVIFQASVQSTAIFGFARPDAVDSQRKHVAAGLARAQKRLSSDLQEYIRVLQDNPAALMDEVEKDAMRKMVIAEGLSMHGGGTVTNRIPSAIGMLKSPQFQTGQDDYVYTALESVERVTGAVIVRGKDGKGHEYKLGWSSKAPRLEASDAPNRNEED
jgi:hypothetical protein